MYFVEVEMEVADLETGKSGAVVVKQCLCKLIDENSSGSNGKRAAVPVIEHELTG